MENYKEPIVKKKGKVLNVSRKKNNGGKE